MIDLWMEGFAVTGNFGTASYLGTWPGATVAEAARHWKASGAALGKYLNDAGTAVWGCRLFDNERDARATFG